MPVVAWLPVAVMLVLVAVVGREAIRAYRTEQDALWFRALSLRSSYRLLLGLVGASMTLVNVVAGASLGAAIWVLVTAAFAWSNSGRHRRDQVNLPPSLG